MKDLKKVDKFFSFILKLYIIGASMNFSTSEGTTTGALILDEEAEYLSLSDNILEISVDQWDKIDEAATLKDLNTILGITPESEIQTGVVALRESTLRSASSDKYLSNPDLTVCTPELTSLDLSLSDSPGVRHYPKCIKVQRCGGCCSNTARICRPSYSRKVIVKVKKFSSMNLARNSNLARRRRRFRGNSRPERKTESVLHETLNVTVTEHTKCACQCRITELDCNQFLQTYNDTTCSCNCKNRDKREKCSNDRLRYWSEETCACKCRNGNTSKCSTGKVFDPSTCQCEKSTESSSFHYLLKNAEDRLTEQFRKLKPLFAK